MRYQMFGCSLLLAAAAVGCGGDDGNKVHVPDAKVFKDAPASTVDAPPACVTPATINQLGIGTMNMPATFSGTMPAPISKTTSGIVFFGLGFYMDQAKKTAMTIIVPKPANGFQTNTTYTYDPDYNAQAPAALAFIEDGLDAQGMNPAHLLYASTGNVKFTAIGQTQGASVNGAAAMATFREVDQMTGADIAGGCTTTSAGVTFFTTQNVAVQFVPPTDSPAMKWAAQHLDMMAAEHQ